MYTWYQTTVSGRAGLAGELWLPVHFNEHTLAAFLFKCMEEPACGSLPTHPPPIYWIHDIGEAWKDVSEIPAALLYIIS